MKVVLVFFKDGRRRDFPLTAAKTIIGRRSDCGLRVPTSDVSRRHCELNLLDGDLVVRDLGSVNGTYVNGKRVTEHALKAGDELAVGPAHFVVQIDGVPKDVHAPVRVESKAGGAAAGNAPPKGEEEALLLDDTDFELDLFDEPDDDGETSMKKKGK